MFYVLLILLNGPQAGETLGRINRSFLVNLDGFYEGYWSGLEFSTLPFRIQGVLICDKSTSFSLVPRLLRFVLLFLGFSYFLLGYF